MRNVPVLLCMLFVSVAYADDDAVMRFPERVPNRYIIILKDEILPERVPEIARTLAAEHSGKVRGVMNDVLNIFSIEMSDAQAQRLARHPLVRQVEEVARGHLSATQTLPPTGLEWMNLWGLDRLDQYSTVGDNKYQYCETTSNVIAYVVDTGVRGDHVEFVENGVTLVRRGASCMNGMCTTDPGGDVLCPGNTINPNSTFNLKLAHGTAVASVIGGRTIGVAKQVQIVPVKIVHDCEGDWTSEDLVAGLNWIVSTNNPDRNHRPALVNLSLYILSTDSWLASFEQIITKLAAGDQTPNPQAFWTPIPVITSANNHRAGTCHNHLSPARLAYNNAGNIPGNGRVISVGGSARKSINGLLSDVRWECPVENEPCWTANLDCGPDPATGLVPIYGSNRGRIVDIYAPAHRIEMAFTPFATSYREDTSAEYIASKSGTSFAAAFASGMAARILYAEPTLTPRQVWRRMRDKAHAGLTQLDSTYYPDDPSTTDINESTLHNGRLLLWNYPSGTCPN